MRAGTLVEAAREDAHLSRRALAMRAGVPTSTVSRIEAGTVDPTVTMLARLLAAAGEELELGRRRLPTHPTIAGLADAYDPEAPGTKINWTRLRGFLDWLRRHSSQTEAAIATPPARTGTVLDQLLAAIAEKVAADAGLQPPRWTRAVPPLAQRWSPPGTARMLKAAERATPEEFRRRNIVLPAGSLWRSAS